MPSMLPVVSLGGCLLFSLAACGSPTAKSNPSPVDAGAAGPVDSGSGGGPPDACVGETLAALCTAARFTCGAATFTDRCGAPVAGSCGTCGGSDVCGGADGPHVCTPAQWEQLDWPSTELTTIHATWNTPGSPQMWAAGGGLGFGELWLLDGFDVTILDTPSALLGVHGAGGDVWAVGNAGTVLHGDASGFAALPTTELQGDVLNAVWGFAPNDVWVTSKNSVNSIAHWDGARWTPGMLPTDAVIPACTSLWASAPNDLWTVCTGGEIVHWDGKAWTKIPSPTTHNLESIYGFAANDIWVVGDSDTLLHWNGAAWRSLSVPSGGGGLFGVWGAAANDVYAVGIAFPDNGHAIHFDGSTWTEVLRGPRATELDHIVGAQGHLFAFGIPQQLLTFPGLPAGAVRTSLVHSTRRLRVAGLEPRGQ